MCNKWFRTYVQMSDIVDKLTERQRQLELTDTEFAARLSISAAHWSNIRNRKRPLGGKVLEHVVLELPDLEPDVNAYMRIRAQQSRWQKTPDSRPTRGRAG
jgi:hypothetical protein